MDKEELSIFQQIPEDKKNNCSCYFTHDNGGRPFLVSISDETKNVTIFGCDTKSPYLLKEYKNLKNIFLGCDSNYPKFAGNSILLKVTETIYIFIGNEIYQFETNEEIIFYHSLVGNSDVPYPVAVGNDNAYFMLDKCFVSKSCFQPNEDWEDAYTPFYNLKNNLIKKMKNVKIIQKRLF